jgi:hypothetical protein
LSFSFLTSLPIDEEDRHECGKDHGCKDVRPLDERKPNVQAGLKRVASSHQETVANNHDQENSCRQRYGYRDLEHPFKDARHGQLLARHDQDCCLNHGVPPLLLCSRQNLAQQLAKFHLLYAQFCPARRSVIAFYWRSGQGGAPVRITHG